MYCFIASLFHCFSFKKQYQKGQVLLIAVLVMVVALTIGLAVATRTISNLRTSTEEESSQRAFSAAEAGIEQALRAANNETIAASFSNNASFTATSDQIDGREILLNNGEVIAKDDGIDIWLSDYGTYANQWSGTLTIYWETDPASCDPSPSVNKQAAIEIVVLHGPTGNPQAAHYAYDPCTARRTGNSFTAAAGAGTVAGQQFLRSATITVNQGLLARVIPLYAPTKMAVVGNVALPSQGWLITSTGQADCSSGNASGCTVHKLISYKPYPKMPVEFFPAILFAP